MYMTRALTVSLAMLTLSGCAVFAPAAVEAPPPVPAVAAPPPNPGAVLGASGQSADALDQSTAADVAAATAAPAGARELGRVVVALGSPAEQGFWIKTQLAAAPGKGRVVTAGGQSVNVDLIPGTGAALLSLAAFRQLGLGLTDLPEVTVFAD